MTLILKQSTAIDIRVGPFVDATDGVTPETGITLGSADQAEVLKANGAGTVAMAGTFAAVTGCDGWYDYTVATGDVDVVGEVVFVVQDSSVSLPVFVRGQVLEEAVYDDLYAASAAGYLKPTTAGRTLDITATGAAGIDWANVENQATAVDLSATDIQLCDTVTTNTDQRGTDSALLAASAPTNFGDLAITATTGKTTVGDILLADGANINLAIIDSGTAQSVTATTLVTRAAQPDDSLATGQTLVAFSSTLGYAQAVLIDSVSGDTLTINAWPITTPTGTITYDVHGTPTSSPNVLPDVNVAEISKDAAAADNLELDYDGTGYDKTASTIGTVTNLTNQSDYKTNTAGDVPFVMVDSTDHVTRETGLTVTAQRSIDGAAFGAAAGSVAEIGNGVYELAASAADLNGANIVFRFTATGADPVERQVRTYV